MRSHYPVLLLGLALSACSGPGDFRLISESPAEPTPALEAEPDEREAEPRPAEPAEPATAPVVIESADLGATLYATHCAVCHGPEGRGDGPTAVALDPKPVDLTGPRPEDKRGQPGGRRDIILHGSPGSTMPAYTDVLSDAELAAVMEHAHRLRWGPDAELPADHVNGDCQHDQVEGRGRRGGEGRRGGGQGRGGGGGGQGGGGGGQGGGGGGQGGGHGGGGGGR
jgi:mono/diheme cytochrome c family protein